MKCPQCDADLSYVPKLLASETITVAITYSGSLLDAKTISSLIANMERCVKETAKCLGSKKTEVFCTRLDLGEHRFEADLLVTCNDGTNAAEIVAVVNDTIQKIYGKGKASE